MRVLGSGNHPEEEPMKKKRFSEEKIIGVLKEAEAGAKVPD